MDPFRPAPGGLQRPAPLGAQQTLGLNTEGAGPAQPAPDGDLQDAIARLWRHEGRGLIPAAQDEHPPRPPLPLPPFSLSLHPYKQADSTQRQSHTQGAGFSLSTFPVFTRMLMADQCVLGFN